MNVMIYLCILIISIFSVYFFRKLLGKLGLIVLFVMMSITSYLLTFKYITIASFSLNSNSITSITMFTTLYLLLEENNDKDVKKIINLNFILNIFSAIVLYLMTIHTQSITDTVSINMKNIFLTNLRVLIAFPLTTLVANHLLVWMYGKIKKIYDNMFITTTTTYLFVGLIEGILYILFSYYNLLSFKAIIQLILSTYMIRLIITVLYSLFLMKLNQEKVIK